MQNIQCLTRLKYGFLMSAIVSLTLLTGGEKTLQASETHNGGHTHDHSARESKDAKHTGDPYLLAIDAATGELLGDDPVILVVDSREFRFTNDTNAQRFKNSPEDFIAEVDAQLIAMQVADYPLDVCVVAGGKLGSMGEPANRILRNRLVRLCCAGCEGALKSNPDKYLNKLDEAVIEQQHDAYPTERCIVSGEALTDHGDPVDRVYGTTLVRFCCGGCIRDFEKNPLIYLEKLQAHN